MNVFDAIQGRRSIKRFADRPIERELLQRLLDAAVLAPNHRLTQPWRFVVLGPESRRAYGEAAGRRKAAAVDDPQVADAVVRKVEEDYAALPAVIGVAVRLDDDARVREEDYAATFMAVENLCLEAVELGLGTHIKTGAVLDDARVREALRLAADERLIALVHVGYPAELPQAKARTGAEELTRWLP